MTPLKPEDFDRFTRQYRWAGGKLSRLRFKHRRGDLVIDMVLRVRSAIRDLGEGSQPVRLHLKFAGVEECRFQKRPAKGLDRLADVRFGAFDGMIFANFDAWALASGDRPAIFDFRGSEAYLAAKSVTWEELPRPAA